MTPPDATLAYRVTEAERMIREVRDRQIMEGARVDALTKEHTVTKKDVAELKSTLSGIELEIKALRDEQKQNNKGTTAILRIIVVLVPLVPVILHIIGAR